LPVRAAVLKPAGASLGAAAITPLGPMVILPGSSVRAQVRATVDRRTPPGRYEAEVSVDGHVRRAVLQVPEEIDLQVSESQLVVAADPDSEQVRSVVLTNAGNVPLRVHEIGPVELEHDPPARPLLERLGVLRAGPPAAGRKHPAPREDERDCDERPATVVGRLPEALVVEPGESVPCEWRIRVSGPLRAGVRYRASAPLYLTDVTFVVTPSQEPATDGLKSTSSRVSAPAAAEKRPRRSRAAGSTPQKRRDG
jgi:hypothetical protein